MTDESLDAVKDNGMALRNLGDAAQNGFVSMAP